MRRHTATVLHRRDAGHAPSSGSAATSSPPPTGRRAARCCFGCCGGALLLFALAAWLLRPPPAPPLPPPSEMARGRERIEQARRAVEHIAAAGERAEHVSLELKEADLNSFIATDRGARDALAEAGVTQAFVRIRDGVVELTAARQAGGLPIGATAHLRPRLTTDGRLRFEVERVTLGRTGVPIAGARQLAERLAFRFAEGRLDPALRAQEVQVAPGVVRLRVRPLRENALSGLAPSRPTGEAPR